LKVLQKRKLEFLLLPKELWDGTILENIRILKSAEFKIEYTYEEIDPINWNEEWEKNFEAIDVEGNCHVRAPFHPKLMLNLTF
jgi:ribosomal protein L11 methyltransferase